MKQILDSSQAHELRKFLQKQNKSIVLVGGCFDIIHVGHIALLENAKKLGDILVVLLESDQTIKHLKGKERPLHTQLQRATVLQALRAVDYVILLKSDVTNDDYDQLTKAIQPAIIATTENDPEVIHKKRQANICNAKLIFVTKQLQGVSTTRIVSALYNEL